MEIRRGYKQTDVGVIPEDWDVALVSSLLALPIQNGVFNEPSRKGRGLKLINVIDLYGSFPIDTKELERFDANRDEVLRFGVKHGDMFFTRSSLTPDGIAKCNVYRGDGNEEVVFDCHIIRVRPNSMKAEPFYLARYCNSRPARSYLVANAKTTTMTTIDQSVVAKLPVPLPPLPEQRAIAEVLSDVDGLLGGLDRLIAKKRDLKQAAMQQLLTGQTRLPGFHGEWEVKTFGELFNFSGGYSASRDQLSSEGHCYLHYGDIHGATKTTVDVRADYQDIPKLDISLKRVATKSLLEDGDVVFVDASEDDEGTSRHVVVVNKDKKPFISGLHTIVAKSKTDELAHEYRRYCFQTAAIRQQFLFYAVGTKVSGISKTNIAKLTMPVPKVPEQTAIAEVLSDMDAELAALEQRRDKTRALKQAMMQELLTGRIRLVKLDKGRVA